MPSNFKRAEQEILTGEPCGLSKTTINKVRRILDECPATLPDIRSGKISIHKAWRSLTAEDPLQSTVYFIREENGQDDFVKVGFTDDAYERPIGLQVGNPRKLVIIDTISCPREFETHLKRQLKDRNVRGEWFRLSPEEVEHLINWSKEVLGIV